MTKVFQLLNSMNLKPHTFERFLKKKWNNVSLSRDILEECVEDGTIFFGEDIVLQDNLEREKSSGAKQPGLPEATSSMQLDADLQKKKKSICDNCTVA